MKKRELLAWMIDGPRVAGASAGQAAVWKGAIKRYELKGTTGECCLVLDGPAVTLLLGIGGTDAVPKSDRVRAVVEAATRAAETAQKHRFDALRIGGVPAGCEAAAIRGARAAFYSFRNGGRRTGRNHPEVTVEKTTAAVGRSAEIVHRFSAHVRDLVNLPPALKYPAALVERIRGIARSERMAGKLKIEVWDEKRLNREKCGGILAVGRGSDHPPRLVGISYAPRGARRHIVLVGKGVTFDAGGLSIKTWEGMKTMKCDMAGAATVTGAVMAAAALGLKVRVTALLGLAENMLGGRAYKPGDVIRLRSGKTVEVLNTDAEGRIVLADVLDVAIKQKPDAMIDLATLTGACMVALGEETAGLFSWNERLVAAIERAADKAGESIWRLPMGRDHRSKLKGDVSDLKNIGGRYGGALTAAQFLSEFVGDSAWAHLDIAGPAFREGASSGRPGGATAFGLATLIEYLAEEGKA